MFFVSGCDTVLPEIGKELNAEEIYEQNKESVLLIKSCPFVLSYPEYTIESDWSAGEGDYVWIYIAKEGTKPFKMKNISVPYLASASGFVINDKVITNAHVFDCEKKESFEYLESYLARITHHVKYSRELGETDYRDYEYKKFLENFHKYIDIDLDKKASEILNDTRNKKFGDTTIWNEENIKDEIIWALALHIIEYGEIVKIGEDYATAYDLEKKYDEGHRLFLLDKGEPWPGIDYAILGIEGGNNFKNLELGDSDEMKITDKVFIISYPGIVDLSDKYFPDPTISGGLVSSKKKTDLEVDYIQTDLSAAPGSSGGPVFDKYGKIIGILTAGDTTGDFNFLLPINYAKESLNNEYDFENIYSNHGWDWDLEKEEVVDVPICKDLAIQKFPEYIMAEEAQDSYANFLLIRYGGRSILNTTWKDGGRIIFDGPSGSEMFVKGKWQKQQNLDYFYSEDVSFRYGEGYGEGPYFDIYNISLERVEDSNKFKIIDYKIGVCDL